MTHLSKALASVASERARQVEQEEWSPQHDDLHDRGELAAAAAVYALSAVMHGAGVPPEDRDSIPDFWPWAVEWYKPTNQRRDLVKAAALIVAEIERLDRKA